MTVTPKIILATSNGMGMGHLSRQVAVASALRDDAEPMLFSLSTALATVASTGVRGEYCPSYHRGWMPRREWSFYLRDRLHALAEAVQPRVIAFDGVAPYKGLLWARDALPDVAFVWFRRGLWRPGTNHRALKAASFFDLILEPGDLAASADRGPTAHRKDALRIPPITLFEQVDPLPRAAAAAALGLDPDRLTALVTLGGDAAASTEAGPVAVHTLASAGWQVAVTQPALVAAAEGSAGSVIALQGVYPLVRYLAAFDAAVSAAGYNGVHELVPARIPTVFVPRIVQTDDQVLRAETVAGRGLALTTRPDDGADVADKVGRLLDQAVRRDLTQACADLPPLLGAASAAHELLALSQNFRDHPAWRSGRGRYLEMRTHDAVERVLGEKGTTVVRRMLGRTVGVTVNERLRVVPTESTDAYPNQRHGSSADVRRLIVTEQCDTSLLTSGDPVEHLLPGMTEQYREERLRIAGRHYDVVTSASLESPDVA